MSYMNRPACRNKVADCHVGLSTEPQRLEQFDDQRQMIACALCSRHRERFSLARVATGLADEAQISSTWQRKFPPRILCWSLKVWSSCHFERISQSPYVFLTLSAWVA